MTFLHKSSRINLKGIQMKNFNKNAILLLIGSALNHIISLFINTFLIAYLLQINTGNIINISIFYIIVYAIIGLLYVLISMWLTQKVKIRFFRTGIILKCILILLIALLKSNVAEYIVLIALFLGVSEAFYWTSFNVMQNELINRHKIQKQISLNAILKNAINIVVPITLGAAIELYSFSSIAIIVCTFSVTQIVLSFFIKSEYENTGTTNLKSFIQTIKKDKVTLKPYKYLYITSFFYGLKHNLNTLITIMTIFVFSTTFNLGVLTSVVAVFSIVALFIFLKFYNSKKYKHLVLTLVILSVLSILTVAIKLSPITLIIFNFVYVVTMCILETLFTVQRNNLIKLMSMRSYITQNQSVVELFVNFGRVCAYGLMLIFSMIFGVSSYSILLYISVFAVLLYGYFVYKTEKEVASIKTE